MKISETIKSLFRRQPPPPPMTEERAAPAEAERQREQDRLIEQEKLRTMQKGGGWL